MIQTISERVNDPTKKITVEPGIEGFHKVEGTSVEEVIKILEEKGMNIFLVHPSEHHFDEDREHTIILTRAEYHQLIAGEAIKPSEP